MVRSPVICVVIVQALCGAVGTSAQDARDIIGLIGGIMRSAIAQAAQAEWQKLPSTELVCVEQFLHGRGSNLRQAIEEGIVPTDPRIADGRSLCRAKVDQPISPPLIRTNSQKSVYSVGGLSLGERVRFGSGEYREYACSPSEQFNGFTWCKKTQQDKERRGSFSVSYTILHSTDGSAFYINRYQEPAFWSSTEAADDIERLSRKFAEQPRPAT